MDISLGLIKFGADLWLRFRPWRRLKVRRNRKREARGLPPLPLSEDDMALFPKNTMRKTGIGVATLSPILGVIAQALGAPAECAPEAIDMGCVSAAQIGSAIGVAVGGALYVLGSIRADRRKAKGEEPKE